MNSESVPLKYFRRKGMALRPSGDQSNGAFTLSLISKQVLAFLYISF
jgi:hypothetical protein